MADGESSPAAGIKRKRPALACDRCRRRKVRCDRETPCEQCVRTNNASRCSYTIWPSSNEGQTGLFQFRADLPRTSGSGDHSQSHNHKSHSHSSAHQDTDGHESGSLRTHSGEPEPAPGPSQKPAKQDRTILELRQRLRLLELSLAGKDPCGTSLVSEQSVTRMVQEVHELDERLSRIERHLTAPVPTPEPKDSIESFVPSTKPRLRAESEKNKLFGQTHWMHTLDQLHGLNDLDAQRTGTATGPGAEDLVKMLRNCQTLRATVKAQQMVKLNDPIPDILSEIPSRNICDLLVSQYFRTFELVFRVLHVPSFWKEYHQFWEQPYAASTCFVMKLILVLAIGTTFHDDIREFDMVRSLSRRWIYAAQWWLTGPAERSAFNVDGLQAFCLLIIARQTNALAATTCVSTGSLLRLAFHLGLHRDPSNFPQLSVFQGEMRRRLWATIVELSLLTSLDSSMPLLFSLDDFDTKPPLNINDQDIDPLNNTPPIPTPVGSFTDSSIQILLLKSFPTRAEMVRLMNVFKHQQSYQTALDLVTKLRDSCREVASLLNGNGHVDSNSSLTPTEFHHKFLDSNFHRTILLLLRPFMIQSRKDPRFYLARKLSLESSLVITSYTHDPTSPSDSTLMRMDDFSRLNMVGRGSLKGPLSLEVIVALGFEIITQIEEESSTQHADGASLASNTLDQLARAGREPLIKRLEHVHSQLLEIIKSGQPSFKRYIILSAILTKIRASDSEPSSLRPVYETIGEGLADCLARLKSASENNSPSAPAIISAAPTEVLMPPTAGMMSFDFDATMYDNNMGFDIFNLFNFQPAP